MEIKSIKASSIKTQGRMTVEEIQAAMADFEGKAAPCDHKYKPYTKVDVPKVNLVEFLNDLMYVLKADNDGVKVGS